VTNLVPHLDETEVQSMMKIIENTMSSDHWTDPKPNIDDKSLINLIAKKCRCAYKRFDENENRYWNTTHGIDSLVLAPCNHALYLPADSTNAVIILSDTMATELAGSS
jgi:hypothetical protein